MEDRSPQPLLKSLTEDLQSLQERITSLLALLRGSGTERGLGQSPGVDAVDSFLVELSRQNTQQDILSVLLTATGTLADRSILFQVEGTEILPIHGVGLAGEQVEELRLAAESEPFKEVLESLEEIVLRENPAEVLPWLEKLGEPPATALIVPLVFGSSAPLLLYVDSSHEISNTTIQLLVRLTVVYLQNHYMAYLLQKRAEEEASRLSADDEIPSEGREELSEAGLDPETEAILVDGPDVLLELTAEEEEAAHGEARRLARLLVAEIKLYNEEEVEEGRREGDLYRRLKTDIERSRKMYEKRVHPVIKTQADYFESELVRVLAMEDPALMGEGHPDAEVLNPISPEGS